MPRSDSALLSVHYYHTNLLSGKLHTVPISQSPTQPHFHGMPADFQHAQGLSFTFDGEFFFYTPTWCSASFV